jgi:C-terminal processing protease CtpA/Prc
LPPGALGPCFRAGAGEYVAYDPGCDVEATQTSSDARVVGVRDGGPAAKAGLLNGDVVESMTMRNGDVEVPVKLVVGRAGAHVTIAYAPKGARGRGQTWSRVRGVADERCGDVL